MGYQLNLQALGIPIDNTGSGGGDTFTTNNFATFLAPQLFNPDASAVTANTDDFTVSTTNGIGLVAHNGQVLDDSEYSLVGTTLTVTPDNGFTDTSDEVLVFQYNFALGSTGGASYNFVQKTANYTVLNSDYYIECTANSFTVTLLSASGIGGQTFVIKNSGTGTITVDGNGSETIDGELNQTLSQNDSMTVVSNGTNWIIV